jgi:LysM repeat protein
MLSGLLDRLGPGEGDTIEYTVQAGDTLLDIAIRFDVETEAIMYLNGLGDEDYIWEGQVLIIPATAGYQP